MNYNLIGENQTLSSEKLREFRFRVHIPNSEARYYLNHYDSLNAVISVQAYSIEDAFELVDALFLNSPFDIHPLPFGSSRF